LQAKEIEPKLKELYSIALSVEPGLAKRLVQIGRWIKSKPPGLIERKRFVKKFLEEILTDAETWLQFKLASPEEKQLYLDLLLPANRYWCYSLFPKWFQKADEKFSIWRQKLMAEEFKQDDRDVIASITSGIKKCENENPDVCQRNIADLSMATDLIVSGSQGKPLCIQITSLSDEYYQNKYQAWEATVRYWEIERGLFASYNPGSDESMARLVNGILSGSNSISSGKYLKIDF
jgi:hypothetical protein